MGGFTMAIWAISKSIKVYWAQVYGTHLTLGYLKKTGDFSSNRDPTWFTFNKCLRISA